MNSMECLYCGAELECTDYYGKMKYAEHYYTYPQSQIEKEGDIYKCPNSEGFETKEDAIRYAKENNIEYNDWEDICCNSGCFNGNFYTDKQENLYEGYPC